ncbi:ASST-domain-containing protein [Aspergillus stella-maris]|uniref:ASST-domain-containing protein n=1 Tax=Aspergillus stella-maris TaxID=1810926 RepID=UPI003CCCEFC8
MLFPYSFSLLFLAAAVLGQVTSTTLSLSLFDDSDQIKYHTIFELRASKWNVTYYDRDAVAPGYWFVAPYWYLFGEKHSNRWTPCQVGPYIYDQDGELVWAGSCKYENRNVWNFKAIDIDNVPHLALRLVAKPDEPDSDGYMVLLNDRYEEVSRTPLPAADYDTHELQITLNPRRGISIVLFPIELDLAAFGLSEVTAHIDTGGFIEFDLETGNRTFQWNAHDHIGLDESFVFIHTDEKPNPDYAHLNSVQKTDSGDYLLSARHCDTIYYIDGLDGHIIWRLGGRKSSFAQDFHFERQHDARFLFVNETHMTLTFLNNAADERAILEYVSSAMHVSLDLTTMTATLLTRYNRPDGEVTNRRGNVQTIPFQRQLPGPNHTITSIDTTNVLASWSNDAYISEHKIDGTLLMEARFASQRFDTYRAFKFPWVSRAPSSPPVVAAAAHGMRNNVSSSLSTTMHVSWNGATEVRYWRFYARAPSSSIILNSTGLNGTYADANASAPTNITQIQPRVEIGTVPKRGFETSFTVPGFMGNISVEALDVDGLVLGSSKEEVITAPPVYWDIGAEPPTVDDPAVILVAMNPALEVPAKLVGGKKLSVFEVLLGAVIFLAGLVVGRGAVVVLPFVAVVGTRGLHRAVRWAQSLAVNFPWLQRSRGPVYSKVKDVEVIHLAHGERQRDREW